MTLKKDHTLIEIRKKRCFVNQIVSGEFTLFKPSLKQKELYEIIELINKQQKNYKEKIE